MGAGSSSQEIVSDDRLRERIRRKVLLSKKKYAVNMSTEELLSRVFNETDVDASGELNHSEFLKAAAILGVEATPHQIHLVFHRFDADGGGTISKEEFLTFMTAQNTRRATTRAEPTSARARRATQAGKVIEHADDATAVKLVLEQFQKQIDDLNIGVRRGDIGLPAQDEWAQRSQAWEAKLDEAQQRLAEMRKANDPFHDQTASAIAKANNSWFNDKRRSPGWHPSRGYKRKARFFEEAAKEATLSELQHVTRFGSSHIMELHKFFPATNLPNRGKGFAAQRRSGASAQDFTEFLAEEHPQIGQYQSLYLRLFSLFDVDGVVDVDDFLVGMIKNANVALEEKIRLLFTVLSRSSHHSGTDIVVVSRVHGFLKDQHEARKAKFELTKSFLMTMNTDEHGQLSMQQIDKVLTKNNVLLISLSQSLPYPTRVLSMVQRLSQGAGGNWEFSQVKEIWEDFLRFDEENRGKAQKLDMKKFCMLVDRYFMPMTAENKNDVENLFNAFCGPIDNSKRATRKQKIVDLIDIMRGLAVILAPNPRELVTFYFRLFDADNDGTVDEKELELMLVVTGDHLLSDFDKARKVLYDLEKENGGDIALSDMLAQVNLHPQLLSVFYRHLNV